MVFKTDPLDESQIEEINLEDQIGRVQKRNHLCQVCGNSFASESQLFNHFDASSSKESGKIETLNEFREVFR